MKLSLKWLLEKIDLKDLSINEIEDRFVISGSKTEGVFDFSKGNSSIVVGKILTLAKHPDADKLSVLTVDIGDEIVQIVTGATNVAIGQYIPVAKVGATLSNGLTLKKSKLRGLESFGMLCSLEELGYEDSVIPKKFSDGIYIFESELPLGKDIFELTDLGDKVIEFEITPNRPDCLSVNGLAKEARAAFSRELNIKNKEIKVEFIKNDFVKILEKELCPRYDALIVRDVKISSSPQWMQIRLMQAGMRPINSIVDITNYVMLETGNPTHAFDLDKVNEGIIVRRALEGENTTTLDGIKRELSVDDLVITDKSGIIGIAGIMGNENSEIDEETKNIVVEIANFNKTSIRNSSRRIGLRTEASSRFEKGISPLNVEDALFRIIELVEELGVGTVDKNIISENNFDYTPTVINGSVKKVLSHIGIYISNEEFIRILNSLEIDCQIIGDSFEAKVPYFRLDLQKEIDIVEEIARIYGYDKIPTTLPTAQNVGGLNEIQNFEKKVKSNLTGIGFNEILTYSFISPGLVNKLNTNDEILTNQLRLLNPLGEEFSAMRTTLISNMLEKIEFNLSRSNDSGLFFEIGNTFLPSDLKESLPQEIKRLTLSIFNKGADFFQLKGILEYIFEKLEIKEFKFIKNKDNEIFHPGKCANIIINGEIIGTLGEIHPIVLDNFSIKTNVILADLDFNKLFNERNIVLKYNKIPQYPAIERDIAILVKDELNNDDIIALINEKSNNLLESVKLFDVYKGKQIEVGYKSMAYNLVFRSKEGTLTDEEVKKPYEKILKALEDQLGAVRR